MKDWEGGKEEGRGGNDRGEKRGTPKGWFTPHGRNPKNTLIAELI